MPAIKEFREFFERAAKVFTGTKPDQELDFDIEYLVSGTKRKNRFLAGHYPSENVFLKLFQSIPFKLNKEDTASTTIQGLAKRATDAIAIARTKNLTTDFTIFVVPHQLPDVVATTDGSDTLGSPVIGNGITITPVTRDLGGGYSKKNFLIKSSNLDTIGAYLDANYVKSTNTSSSPVGTGGVIQLQRELEANCQYEFEAMLFVSAGNTTGGYKVGTDRTGSLAEIVYNISYIDANGFTLAPVRHTNTGSSDTESVVNSLSGTFIIKGTVNTTTTGKIIITFAQSVASSTSTVLKGSYVKFTKIL